MSNLSDKWTKFAEEQNKKLNFDKKLRHTKEFFIQHKEAIDVIVEAAKTAGEFAVKKSPFTLIKGVGLIVSKTVKDMHYSYVYFSSINGWEPVFGPNQQTFNKVISSVLDQFEYRELTFVSDRTTAQIHNTPMGEVAVSHTTDNQSINGILCRIGTNNNGEISKYLIDLKVNQLGCRILKLNITPNSDDEAIFGLAPAELNIQPSIRAEVLTEFYKRAFALGIKRSAIFYGPPGSGKTSLAHTILQKLELKTLIYTYSGYHLTDSTFLNIIDMFGIEAVILDDFDQLNNTKQMLSFLDILNRKLKLVIGIVNKMQDFHPAVIRPRRFDQYYYVDAIEESGVKNLLADLGEEYFDRTKKWPVAYINEIVNRSKLYPKEELQKHFEELNERAEKQFEALK